MSVADKYPPFATRIGQDPLSDPSLPAWKRDLILKRRLVNRTIPRLSTSTPPPPPPPMMMNETRHKSVDVVTSSSTAVVAATGQQQQQKRKSASCTSAIYPSSSCYSSIHASRNNLNSNCDVFRAEEGADSSNAFDLNAVSSSALPSISSLSAVTSGCCSGIERVVKTAVNKSSDITAHVDSKQPTMGEDKADECVHNCDSSSTSPDSRHHMMNFDDVFDSVSDGFGELEYGPGIVNRLRSKFISLTLNRDVGGSTGFLTPFTPVRRVASCEQLLDVPDRDPVLPVRPISPNILPCATKYQRNVENGAYIVSNNNKERPAVLRYASRWSTVSRCSGSRTTTNTTDVIKRARSMETLCAIDRVGGPPIVNRLILGVRPAVMKRSVSYNVRDDPPSPLALVNENVVIIEQTKPVKGSSIEPIARGPSLSTLRVAQDVGRRGAALDEDEFPKPDTVRTFKRIFEPNGVQSESKMIGCVTMGTAKIGSGPPPRKMTPPPKPVGLKPTPRNDSTIGAKNTKVHSTTTLKPVFKFLEVDNKEELVACEPVHVAHEPVLKNGDITDGMVKPVSETELMRSSVKNEGTGQCPVIGLDSGAKMSVVTIDYVATHLKPVSEPRLTSEIDQTQSVVNDKPKVVSIHPKSDEKPIGHIRPFQKLEQQKNRTNELKSSTSIDGTVTTEVGSSLDVPDGTVAVKKSPQRLSPVTQTFNFVGKDVQPHISNTAAPFSVKRPTLRNIDKVGTKNKENLGPHQLPSSQQNSSSSSSYIIAGSDLESSWREFLDEEEDDDALSQDLGSVDYLKPVNVVFIGSNVIVGRSSLLKNRNKKLRIAFNDSALSTFEYPSEGSLLDDGGSVLENGSSSDGGSVLSETAVETPVVGVEAKQLKSTPAIGSAGGLASYTPMAIVGSGQSFELGVSRAPPPPIPVSKVAEMTSSSAGDDDDDIFLKPASDEQNSTWSNSETADLLF